MCGDAKRDVRQLACWIVRNAGRIFPVCTVRITKLCSRVRKTENDSTLKSRFPFDHNSSVPFRRILAISVRSWLKSRGNFDVFRLPKFFFE